MKVNGCWHWIKRIEIEFWPPPPPSTLLMWKSYIQTPKYESLHFSKIKSMFYGPPLGCEQLVSRKFISQSRLHIFFSLVWLGVTFQFWKFTRVLYNGTRMFRCSIESIRSQFKKHKNQDKSRYWLFSCNDSVINIDAIINNIINDNFPNKLQVKIVLCQCWHWHVIGSRKLISL